MTALPADLPALPSWDTPVVAPSLVLTPGPVPVSIYADEVWSLAPLVANPSAPRPKIDWSRFPDTARPQAQLATWMMINTPLPASVLVGHPTWHSRLGPPGIHDTVLRWQRFTDWLHQQGVGTLHAVTDDVLIAWAGHLARQAGAGRGNVTKDLVALTRLWAFDAAGPAPSGMAMPPWHHLGVDDFLPRTPSSGRGENTTEAISPATMGPLLIWALRVVDDFADDILTAWAESLRMTEAAASTPGTQQSKSSLKHYLHDLIDRGHPVPARPNASYRHALANTYIAATVGCSTTQVNGLLMTEQWQHLPAYVDANPGPCPLDTPITSRIDGEPWTAFIDFTETRELMRHLGTACFIVLAYLTGMRPAEVLGLHAGCCPEVVTGRHLIYGREFKNAFDHDGNHHSAGRPREVPWVAIAHVVRAIRVLEKIAPDQGLLFDAAAHTFAKTLRPSTSSLGYQGMRLRIEAFAAWASTLARRLGRGGEVIPDDPHGAIGLARFRRTLAWHIARRPGGLVALAIQYGHMRTSMSGGYAARGRDGIHELLDIETARATADTLTNLHDDLTRGVGISGPAAQRAIHAAAQAPTFAGSIRTQRQAHDILRNPALTVYDNPNAFLMCVYNRDRALCHRLDLTEAPRLDRCQPSCANIARTDQHAEQLREHAQALDKQAASETVPGPSLTGSPDAPDTCAGWRTGTDETALTYRSRRHEPSPG
ncbi:integrase [Streptomyces sp. AC602_WCS936]|uniref:integrase n=1 Tax=Streptomyces sp. AC602_WCS936 TaxID=2823685 RepID=UPI001C272CFC|nr:integrase [Streptomyces sp. AC602_WCS936]